MSSAVASINGLDELKAAIPDYAKDIKLNLSTTLATSLLSAQQLWGTALAVAIVGRNSQTLQAIDTIARQQLTDMAYQAAKSAAAIMAMNNIYYRAKHLIGDEAYQALPARLRMQVIGAPGVDKADFELWCLAVSAIFGCGTCLASHEKTVTQAGVAREVVHEALRVASVIHAVSVVLAAESTFEYTAAV